jgi:hypothetical protein
MLRTAKGNGESTIIGHWKCDKLQGYGEEFSVDGISYKGYYKDGKR